jgi:hypothetical protein
MRKPTTETRRHGEAKQESSKLAARIGVLFEENRGV